MASTTASRGKGGSGSSSPVETDSINRKMMTLAVELDLIQEFLHKTFGTRVLNTESKYFKDLHTLNCPEMDRIRSDLDLNLQSEEEEVEIHMKSFEIKQEIDDCTEILGINQDLDLETMGNQERIDQDESASIIGHVLDIKTEDFDGIPETTETLTFHVIQETGTEEEPATHPKTQKSRPFKCRICSKSFTTKSIKDRHEKTHSGERPFKCRHCGQAFTQIGHRNTHERTHTNEKPYKCRYCEARFNHSSNKKLHEERVHTEEGQFLCQYCGKRFKTLSDRNRHHRSHTGEKPYTCEICAVSFRQAAHLAGHKRTHRHRLK